jgi:ATP-dependent DNA helicase 2 subunit 1
MLALCARKIIIARYVPRSNAVPRLVALLPQAEIWIKDEVTGQEKGQHQPTGFHVIVLPYADEIRNLEADQNFDRVTPHPEQVLAARQMVQTLELDYDPTAFVNPALQKHFAYLQAYALNKDEPVDVEDCLFPDAEGLQRFEGVINSWKETLPQGLEGGDDDDKKSTTRKRATAPADYDGDWDELVRGGDSNMRLVTVPQLKTKLKALGKPVSGNKPELWERLKAALDGGAKERFVRVKKEERVEEEEF